MAPEASFNSGIFRTRSTDNCGWVLSTWLGIKPVKYYHSHEVEQDRRLRSIQIVHGWEMPSKETSSIKIGQISWWLLFQRNYRPWGVEAGNIIFFHKNWGW